MKLGVDVGYESDGKGEFMRPVLVAAKIGNLYWSIPLTTKEKCNIFHHQIESLSFGKVKKSFLILSQAKVLDARRFEENMGTIQKSEFKIIQHKLKVFYMPEIK